ncbi:MAG: hypothetical protein DMF81_26820, partial [Acidobacteria bacterium]
MDGPGKSVPARDRAGPGGRRVPPRAFRAGAPARRRLARGAAGLAARRGRPVRTRHGHLVLDGRAAALGISPAFDARSLVSELLKGAGAEVGPGLNPHVHPGPDVDVTYVEVATADDWVTLYRKRDKPPPELTGNLWKRYLVSRAETLEAIADGTLDFVFSNHVFEHLMNPLGVLENWSRKLKSRGIVYNVVPDAGCCFDLRQPLSEPSE